MTSHTDRQHAGLGGGSEKQQGQDRTGGKIEEEKVDAKGSHVILYTVSGQAPTIFKVTGVELGWLGCLATLPPKAVLW